MVATSREIQEIEVEPDSEMGKLLALARYHRLRLIVGDTSYRVDHEPLRGDEWEDHRTRGDHERSAAAWRASFGILKGIDLEAFKADMKEQRGQDTPGRPGV